MNPKVIFSIGIVLTTLAVCSGRAASNEPTLGKYQDSKSHSTYDDGKYRPVKRNEGRYIHMVQPYVHVHDNRELGQYRHIAIPYDGGYGPYAGLVNPYVHDDHGNYDKYTTTTTTQRPTTTTTTTTPRPRISNYHDEGGWRIIRQEEEKRKHKYDYLYLTENGIYGEEKAHLRKGAGTAATGYYEYTGDDGELYRVNYKSDERGFIPEADHIPTPPPIPEAIKRALEYNAKKKEIHGSLQTGQYEHKPDPVKRQNMPTNDRPLSDSVSPPTRPKIAPPPLPTLLPQARFLNYNANSQYNPLPTGLGSVTGGGRKPKEYSPPAIAADQSLAKAEPLPQAQPLVKSREQAQEQQVVPDHKPIVEEQPQQEPPQQDQPQKDLAQQDQPQKDLPQQDQPPQDQPQQNQPPQDQPPQDQPPQDQPQQDQPQQDQPPTQVKEKHQADQPQQSEQPAELIAEAPGETVAASERYHVNYQAPEQLKNQENFEFATA